MSCAYLELDKTFFVISSISHQPFPDHLMRLIGRGWRKSGKPRSKRSGGRSWVWKHLRKGSEKVGCLYCPSEFSLTSSTGTLKTHLVGTHKLEPENVTSGTAGKVDLEALVFAHYIPMPEREILMCEHCNDEFNIATSTKDLEQHLKTTHDINP